MATPITKPHAAMFCSPGMGHLVPFFELAKRFVTQLDFQVTIFVLSITDASTIRSHQFLHSASNLFNIVSLPPVDISGLVDTPFIGTKIAMMMHQSLPALRSAISEMTSTSTSSDLPPVTALIVDIFGIEALAIAEEFRIPKYVFDISSAWYLATMLYAPTLDVKVLDEHANKKLPIKIPGCTTLHFEDTHDVFEDPNSPARSRFLCRGKEASTADGFLVNTWEDLEPKTLKALRDTKLLGSIIRGPVYPVGPMAIPVGPTPPPQPVSRRSHVLDWLDLQPTESVIYVSFGSGGTLSAKQTIELAYGLELSQQRFVWLVRAPVENDASGSYLTVGNDDRAGNIISDYLPDGFLSRTYNVGLVVPTWAPQTEILGHPSIGGFLSHCGWNSSIESIVNGVPMVAWPFYADHKLTAAMLTEEFGVAIRLKVSSSSNGVVGREEVKMMVRRIMVDEEGHSIRSRVKELKHSARKALSEGGTSYCSLSQVAKDCQIRLQAYSDL
ncbi:hypothetical protein EZV62_014162 [Acer yangbiense]|uniref:Glycosyltransferase n=1 Tax=Acer yangbiense TaxID=1000413 RepID=A0A5C7HS19_9ROSI|nr:hypothetical protein EZV62_014162 [Acer yangbiense]